MENLEFVLLVDDNDTDNFITKRMIKIVNFAEEVKVKNSGREALEFFKGKPDKLPDLIFLDINMPVVDGFVFLDRYEKFSKKIKKCKIVVLSSHHNLFYVSQLINNKHVIGYVSKPLTEESLINIKNKLKNL